MMSKRIFIDMDGTLAEWKNVESVNELYEKGYYESLKPNKYILNETKKLISDGKDIYILSSFLIDSKYALREKNKWLDNYLPELEKNKRIFVPYGEVKYKYLPTGITNDDYLIDDYTKNLLDWNRAGGQGIKFVNGINHLKGVWKGLLINEHKCLSEELSLILNDDNKFYTKDLEELEIEI